MELLSPDPEPTTQLSLAAGEYNRYPGETATFYLRFVVPEGRGSVQIALPHVMEIQSYLLPDGIPYTIPLVVEDGQEVILTIPLEEPFREGEEYEITLRVLIKTFSFNQYLLAEARLLDRSSHTLSIESVRIAVHARGKYLQFLPELYENDDFTGRFLMLFESMWKPVSQQIDQIDVYFDPGLTPESFIAWLASWIGMPVDHTLPPERMRTLLKSAMMLFQCRGTYTALKKYLQIYTGGEVEVVEQRARNFVLGPQSGLGVDIALGTENRPNTVSIAIHVPVEELERMRFTETMYQRKIEEITRTLVPAHVDYQVHCQFHHLLERRV